VLLSFIGRRVVEGWGSGIGKVPGTSKEWPVALQDDTKRGSRSSAPNRGVSLSGLRFAVAQPLRPRRGLDRLLSPIGTPGGMGLYPALGFRRQL
jgi:hypothetical protein